MSLNKKFLYNVFFALRPNQWIKNCYVILPLIFGKKLFVFPTNVKTLFAFFIFCLAASVVYLVNDIIDAETDKLHPTKRLRPIACGTVNSRNALWFAILLAVICVVLSAMVDIYFALVIVLYVIFNFVYSIILKHIVIIDVFSLGFFFLLRIIAGTIVARVNLSYWMILMVVLLALFLGFNKRRQELGMVTTSGPRCRKVLTEYNSYFIDQMISVITSSIVVFYMLYTVDARTVHLFGTKHLMLSIPFVYYGVFRYLYLIHKVHTDGDPTDVVLRDVMMQLNLVAWVAVCIGVIYFRF